MSRSRYWGTPLPIWRTEDGAEEICIGSVEELYNEIEKSVKAGLMESNPYKELKFQPGEYTKENYEKIDLHRPYVDDVILVSESGKPMKRETDLIDVWFDSGAMPYAQIHYPFENKEIFDDRKVLVVLQYTASLVLLCGTLIVYAQLQYMRNAFLGVRVDQTLVLKFPAQCEELAMKLEAFKKEVALLPSVRAVTVSGAVPGTEVTDFLSIVRESDVTKQTRLLEMLNCDEFFLEAYDLKFVSGRGFSEDYGGDVYKIVLNESAVRTLGFESSDAALGQRLSVETVDQPMQIIGVVKDYHQQSLNKDFTPILFALHEKLSWMKQRYISVVMENGNPRDLVKQVEGVWERYFPDSSYDYFFLDQFFDQQYRQDEVFGLIVALFAILAIFISCMGLAVLVMFSCSTRIREMGIRKVLGASRRQLFFELGREFFLLDRKSVV